MDLGIKNKTALITGADSGIGLETAKILASEGVKIILSDIKEKDLEDAKKELLKSTSDAKVYLLPLDLSDPVKVDEAAEKVNKEWGGIDILVNCAGARGAAGDFMTLTDADWMKTINIDLMGAVRLCRSFLPQLLERKWGRVVTIASENAFQPYIEESPYNACKAAIINLTKCLSRAYSKDNLLFNCVSPAFIETPMTDAMMEELAKERNSTVKEAVEYFLKTDRPYIAVKRRGTPEEVASVIAFLCSDKASYVNGSNYRVDGGAVESAFG
jgi:3-oxoacyl-[acyl-carrier protein] reductase